MHHSRMTISYLKIITWNVRFSYIPDKRLKLPRSLEAARVPLRTAPSTFGLAQKSPQIANLVFLSQRHLSSPPITAPGKALPLHFHQVFQKYCKIYCWLINRLSASDSHQFRLNWNNTCSTVVFWFFVPFYSTYLGSLVQNRHFIPYIQDHYYCSS